ncbi:hypothetical protein, partial [Caballeronia sp.]|uniref:hypothetical protein n=1 Tax=Caballeronia sp. TaxID=1931223 RepID=UPI00262D28EB
MSGKLVRPAGADQGKVRFRAVLAGSPPIHNPMQMRTSAEPVQGGGKRRAASQDSTLSDSNVRTVYDNCETFASHGSV